MTDNLNRVAHGLTWTQRRVLISFHTMADQTRQSEARWKPGWPRAINALVRRGLMSAKRGPLSVTKNGAACVNVLRNARGMRCRHCFGHLADWEGMDNTCKRCKTERNEK